jgi:hypothetical protein
MERLEVLQDWEPGIQESTRQGGSMKRTALGLILLMGCGGDDGTGPTEANFSGTYQGQVYVITTSTTPTQQRDSATGGAVTMTLARGTGENYELSVTGASPLAANVTINQAGVMGFPESDEEGTIEQLSSLLLGICNLDNASAQPSGSVVNSRLTFTASLAGAICDYSGGSGTDLRATLIQVTWTGTR